MKNHLNLIPEAVQRRTLLRRWTTRWVTAWITCAIAIATYCAYIEHQISLDDQRRASMENNAKPIVEMDDAARRFQAELTAIESDDALLHRLTGERTPLNSVGVVSIGASKCGERIWIQRLRLETRLADKNTPGQPTTANTASSGEPTRRLSVSGVAADNISVAEFVSVLREMNAFRRVELKSSLNTQYQGVSAWAFEIESEL